MKKHILIVSLTILYVNCIAQDWSSWMGVGQEIEVSFKFSERGCIGYSFARIRNVSNTRTFCNVTVSFTKICNNASDGSASVSAYHIQPGDVSELKGNWYNMDKAENIKLTTLTDKDCKNLLSTIKSSSGGVNEISYPGKNLGDDYQRKLDSLREEDKKKEKEREEKYEKEKKAIDEQAKKDKKRQDEIEAGAQRKTQAIVSSNNTTYSNSDEGKLRSKINNDSYKNAALQQSLNRAIDATGKLVQTLMENSQRQREIKEKRIEKYQEFEDEINDANIRDIEARKQREISVKTEVAEHTNPNSVRTFIVYKTYAQFIDSIYLKSTTTSTVYELLDDLFNMPENKNISTYEFTRFLNILLWKNAKFLSLVLSTEFSNYIELKKGTEFSNALKTRLNFIKEDVIAITNQPFFAVGSTLATSSLNHHSMLFKSTNYKDEMNFPITFNKTSNCLEIGIGKKILNFSYIASQNTKKNDLITPSKGTIMAALTQINSYSITNLNNHFVFCPEEDIETVVYDVQKTQDSSATAMNHGLTLIKINVDLMFTSSMGFKQSVNANIYLLRRRGGNYYEHGVVESDYYLGYIDDLSPQWEQDENNYKLHNYLNLYTGYSAMFRSYKDMYIDDMCIYCNLFYSLHGLSLLLLTDCTDHNFYIKRYLDDPFYAR